MNPQVSILLSVYNGAIELPVALASIQQQTFQNYEVIAINDGSKDSSGEILERYARRDRRVRVIHQENAGLGAALNRAASEARGALLARQDCDDVSAPTRLERQVEFFRNHPDIVLAGTWSWFVDPELGPHYSFEVPNSDSKLRRFLESGLNPFVHGSVMFRTDTYKNLPRGYRLGNPAQDFDLWLRMLDFGEVGMLESVEYFYFLSVKGISYSTYASRAAVVKLILDLHEQRKAIGVETCFDPDSYEKAVLEHKQQCSENVPDYSRALHALKLKKYRRYYSFMGKAAQGRGSLAKRARIHRILCFLAPVTRAFYAWRERSTPFRYMRAVPESTQLPDTVRRLFSARWRKEFEGVEVHFDSRVRGV